MSAIHALFLLTHLSAITLKCSIYDTPCLASLAQKYTTSIIPGGTGFGIAPLDPMSLPPIKDAQDGLDLSEIEVVGLKNTFIEKVQVNKKEKRVCVKYRVPCLTIYANHTTQGPIGKALFYGDGKSIINLYDYENEFTINYEIVKGNDGKDYIQYNNYLYWFDVRYVVTVVENINKDYHHKAIGALEVTKTEDGKLWQQFGRNFLDKFNDKIFETVKKVLLLQPAENILSDF